MSRRQSRNKSTITYRVGDEYSFLDEDEDAVGSSRKRRPVDQDNDEDGDNFMPDANAEEDPEDDFDEDLVEEEEESDGKTNNWQGNPRSLVQTMFKLRLRVRQLAKERARRLCAFYHKLRHRKSSHQYRFLTASPEVGEEKSTWTINRCALEVLPTLASREARKYD
jgi:hypothetical protein